MPTTSRTILSLIGALLAHSIDAFPFKAGSCRSGAGVGGPHIGDKNGTLTDGNTQFTVNGEILNDGDVITLYSNSTNELKIAGQFKGFLMKVSGNMDALGYSPDAYGTLAVIDDANSQMLPRTSDSLDQSSCLDDESGMSHTSNNVKESILSSFMHEGEGNFTLEVTVVTGNKGLDSDGWYYSPYQVVVQQSPPAETSVSEVVEEIPETGDTNVDDGAKSPSSASCRVVGSMLLFCIGLSLYLI